ncbi:mitochondrial thiamine pyrophosphate carrier [Nilaparvata lugens]|uniref:mitochondrial thiamine pyrophosphate carrier n=1 Tax=Nilaparvata lugens TaxID=108931 RepID=UPI000B98F022|nr:mitochondrial thiamine pyrophosphate carrier [Nilaparvata lugens]XP_022200924.1 mitochondrial thiamine pyrophosphate carrier [Nilaparvata lugens]XP_039284217.1 mitochondrial thiamine pyrophosphate carrier [Nilaparvata lugens]
MNNKAVGKKKTSWVYALAGAGSGVLTRALCQPFDVIKIRFQLQVEPIKLASNHSKYRGTLHCLTTIAKEEGVLGLWRGHLPAQFLSAIYGFVQFQTYEVLKQKLSSNSNGKEHKHYANFLSGAAAGCTATLLSFPFDIIRTRLVAQGNSKAYEGMVDGFVKIYKKEGMQGYFRGSSAALMVSGPLAGSQFLFYELFKSITLSVDYMREKDSETKLIPSGELICGSLSGVMSKLVTYPWDLVRKRLQFQNFQYARVGYGKNFTCKGLINCFKGTFEGENVLGLFKGLSPSLVKAALTTALYFAFYEEILKKLNLS